MTRFGLVFILLTANFNLFGQGSFAGNYASLVGRKYKDDTLSFNINGFTHYQSMILSKDLLVSWHANNELDLVVFSQLQKDHHLILDVLQIEHVREYESTMGNCWNNQRQDYHIIALVKFSDEIKEKAVAAWYFDVSKKRLEKYDASRVYCIKD